MKTYTTVKGQSIIALAVQLYGNVDAIKELLELNDFTNKIDTADNNSWVDIGYRLKSGESINYDDTSSLRNEDFLNELNGRVILDADYPDRYFESQFEIQFE